MVNMEEIKEKILQSLRAGKMLNCGQYIKIGIEKLSNKK